MTKKRKPPIVLGAALVVLLGSAAAINEATRPVDPMKQLQEALDKESKEHEQKQKGDLNSKLNNAIAENSGLELRKKGPNTAVPSVLLPKPTKPNKRTPSSNDTRTQWY